MVYILLCNNKNKKINKLLDVERAQKMGIKYMMEIDDETCNEIFVLAKKIMNILKDVIKKYDEIIFFPNRPVEEKGGKYISLFAEEMKREKSS